MDVGMIAAPARSGATSLVRAHGGTSLARTILRLMLGFLHCRHHQEGTTTNIRTRGLGASRSRGLSPASWAELKPQPLSESSSSLLVR